MKVTMQRIAIFRALLEPDAFALPNGVIPEPFQTLYARHLPVVLRGTKYVAQFETNRRWRIKHGEYVHVWRVTEDGRKWYEKALVQVNLSESRLIEATEQRRAADAAFAHKQRINAIRLENIAGSAARKTDAAGTLAAVALP